MKTLNQNHIAVSYQVNEVLIVFKQKSFFFDMASNDLMIEDCSSVTLLFLDLNPQINIGININSCSRNTPIVVAEAWGRTVELDHPSFWLYQSLFQISIHLNLVVQNKPPMWLTDWL